MSRIVTLLLSVVMIAGCGGQPEPAPKVDEPEIPFRKEGELTFFHDGDEVVGIDIEIADDDSTRTRGLMQRHGLPERSGMLFVFPVEEPQSFWMANTPLALDLLFLDSAGRVVSIARYTRPLSTEPVPSGRPARYVVEVEAGFVDSWGLVEGDSAAWSRTDAG